MGKCHVVRKAGTPTVTANTPTSTGDHYVDTITGDNYHSTGTASPADWELDETGAPDFGVITGDSGTATSDSQGDTIKLEGGDAITTVASDAPEKVVHNLNINKETDVPLALGDEIPFSDVSNSNAIQKTTVQSIVDLATSSVVFVPLVFGDKSKSVKDKFLKFSGTAHDSADSTYGMLADGFVRHVTLKTEEDAANDWDLQIILNATKAGSGLFKGGTQSGGDLKKTAGNIDKDHFNLGTAHPFLQGDRVGTRVKKGTAGSGEAVEPAVVLWIEFTGTI